MWRAAMSCAIALAGCYRPNEFESCQLTCTAENASTDCPSGLTCIEGRCSSGETCPEPTDAAKGCLLSRFLDQLCVPEAAGAKTFESVETTECESPYTKSGDFCFGFGDRIRVGKLRATGAKPLVLVSNTTIELSSTLDVGSRSMLELGAGSQFGCSTFGTEGAQGGTLGGISRGGGGGGGGGYQGRGGDGGRGDFAETPSVVARGGGTQDVGLRGGCRGGSGGASGITGDGPGLAGFGGGVVYLIARDSIIFLEGSAVNAGGGGGGRGGTAAGAGGGGGSGGTIILEAPKVVASGAPPIICANGGGGGGGAITTNNGVDGTDGCLEDGIEAAKGGGSSDVSPFGTGGDGSQQSVPAGGMGRDGNDGAGGGGGGAGFVLVIGPSEQDAMKLGENVSPPATVP